MKAEVKEFEFVSLEFNPANKIDAISKVGAWICQVHSQELLDEEKLKTDREIIDKDYIPRPFPKHTFDPHMWMQVLATIATSDLSPSFQFCDKKGYDVIPLRMSI